MGYEFLIARRHLRSMRGRRGAFTTAIAAAGVALGVAALAVVLSVMNGYSGTIWDRLLGVNAHLTVRKAYSERIADYGPVVQSLKAHPEVAGASPFIHAEGFALRRAPERGAVKSGVLVRGVDPEGLLETSEIAGRLQAGAVALGAQDSEGPGQVYGMVIGRVLADRLEAGPGAEVYLGVIPRELEPGKVLRWRRYVVTGIFSTGYYEFDARLVFVSLPAAQRDLGWGDLVTGIHVRLKDAFSADRVSGELREVLRTVYPSLFAAPWTYEYGNFYALIQLQKWTFFLILSLIVVVAGFNIISILTMNVAERRREIGILKAMGATPGGIGRIFTIEGLAVGACGVLAGNLLGFALCWVQQRYTPIRIPGEVYFLSSLPVEMRAFDFAAISIAAVALCYLFTRLPARDAAALDPVEAIRYE